MSDLIIPARLVAEGVGQPSWWLGLDGHIHRDGDTWEAEDWAAAWMDLSDYQTAFGLALRLDEWEDYRYDDVGPPEDWNSAYWAEVAIPTLYEPSASLPVMIARLTRIGMDHAVRRALGEEPKPGTLMEWRPAAGGWWEAWIDRGTIGTVLFTRHYLPGTTDPDEALAAVHAEVCGG